MWWPLRPIPYSASANAAVAHAASSPSAPTPPAYPASLQMCIRRSYMWTCTCSVRLLHCVTQSVVVNELLVEVSDVRSSCGSSVFVTWSWEVCDGGVPTCAGATAVMAAAGRGRHAAVSALLANGADVLLTAANGTTASQWASRWDLQPLGVGRLLASPWRSVVRST